MFHKDTWHEELEAALLALDDCPLECNGMTLAINHVLEDAGVGHTCIFGYVRNEQTGDLVAPHVWVELSDGWIVDFRLRMWLGDNDEIPHGIFHPANERHLTYHRIQEHSDPGIDETTLLLMTEGRLSHVKVPCRDDKAAGTSPP